MTNLQIIFLEIVNTLIYCLFKNIIFKKLPILFGKFVFFGYHISMKFDVAIIGAGPAGLTAGIFTTRAGLKTVCFERLVVGGQASLSSNIENFPGYTNIVGFELMEKFLNHATSCGLELKYENVVSVTQTQTGFSIKTKKENYTAKKIIIACGCKARKLAQ